MLFNSFAFLIFFPIVTVVYFLLPHRFRWFHLLAASCYFYMAFVPVYILVLFSTIIVDYFGGIYIERSSGRKRKWALVTTIASNILVLCVFKYYNFFIDNTNVFISSLGYREFSLPLLNMILPIGLSFHTFQALSYIIEVNRGNIKAERHFGIYSLYVMFYPQLVAGPIERPQNLLHQFYEKKIFDNSNFIIGFKIILWGFFKKVVIADRLAIYVNEVYQSVDTVGSLHLWIAVFVFFPFQVYCDFSGYSSIAIGTAKIMGFNLMENFHRPFASLTISELWNRWHISLSSWFRDYVYQPLVVRYRDFGKWAVSMALLITFLLSGLWHGAGWNFVFYGLFQGIVIVVEYLAGIKSTKLKKSSVGKIRGIITTYFLFSVSLIFFRSEGLGQACFILRRLFLNFDFQTQPKPAFELVGYYLSLALIITLLYFEKNHVDKLVYDHQSLKKEVGFSSILVIILIAFGVFHNLSFIYFQF